MSLSGSARDRAALLLLTLTLPAPALALDYQIHGFAAQGFALSEGNNVIGDSAHGNAQYFELGVNGTVELRHDLRVSGQEIVRRSGDLYPGDLALDYAFVDYELIGVPSFTAGLRLGRVKNPFGLYNDTRDVVFTRPAILLPSIYLETQGARSLLFASNGGQLYTGWSHGDQYTSVALTRAVNFDVSETDKKIFFSGLPLFGDIRLNDFWVARAMNDWDAGKFRLAASYLTADLTYEPSPADAIPLAGSAHFDFYVASARYDAERFSVTGEYQLMSSRGSLGGSSSNKGDGGYVQADVRIRPRWSAMARFDTSWSNRKDRGGLQCTGATGPAPRYGCFTFGGGAGVHWEPDPHWGVWSEFYQFEGNSQVPTIENLGRAKTPRWNLLLLMAGYRF